jgi:ATP-dependent Lon protease
MTGEITLRGKVLPVGGIKEKVIAAKSAGIRRVVLPDKNEKDLVDVAQPVKDALTFHFVNEIDQVLELAFGPALRSRPVARDEDEPRSARVEEEVPPEGEPESDSPALIESGPTAGRTCGVTFQALDS